MCPIIPQMSALLLLFAPDSVLVFLSHSTEQDCLRPCFSGSVSGGCFAVVLSCFVAFTGFWFRLQHAVFVCFAYYGFRVVFFLYRCFGSFSILVVVVFCCVSLRVFRLYTTSDVLYFPVWQDWCISCRFCFSIYFADSKNECEIYANNIICSALSF